MTDDKTKPWDDADFPEVETGPDPSGSYSIINGRSIPKDKVEQPKEPDDKTPFARLSIDDMLDSSLFGFRKVQHGLLINRLATILRVHFDDYIQKTGSEFLKVAGLRKGGPDREIASADFSPYVLEVLQKKLDEIGEKPAMLKMYHPDYCVVDPEDNIVVPWFKFDVDIPIMPALMKEGGCKVNISYAPCVGFSDHIFETPFDYTAPVDAMEKVVKDVFALSGRPLTDESLVSRIFRHIRPENLKDPENHEKLRDVRHGELYALGVEVIIMEDHAQVSFTDSTGFVAKTARQYEKDEHDFKLVVGGYSAALDRDY